MADPFSTTQAIRAAIERCFEASPAPPTMDDIAAAVLWAVSEGIEHHWDGAECVDHLQALAAELNGTDYGELEGGTPDPLKPRDLSHLSEEEFLVLAPQGYHGV